MARKRLPVARETAVLMKSGRRCSLCFGLQGDGKVRPGQIAHLDRDRNNHAEANLVFLCLPHHDAYDSRRSQSKGLTPHEVREYRTKLYKAVREKLFPKRMVGKRTLAEGDILEHDRKMFRQADALMPEKSLQWFLNDLLSGHEYTSSNMRPPRAFSECMSLESNGFVIRPLSSAAKTLERRLNELLWFIALKFFVYPQDQPGGAELRFCMQPEWNIDRGSHATKTDARNYEKLADELDRLGKAVERAYRKYRRVTKEQLFV